MGEGSLLRNRDFRLVAGSVGVSAMGDWLALVALALQIERMSDSGFAVSALFICLWAPVVVFAGHAGLLVDRFEATRVMAISSLASAGIAAALAFADSIGLILGLSALLGIGIAVSQPAEFALVPAIAGERRVKEANGHVETSRYLGFTLGPVVGGLLAGVGGTDIAMLVNAATFAAVAVAALSLGVRRVGSADGEEGARARDGVVFLFRERLLVVAMSVAFISLLFMSASIPADLFFFKDTLGVSDFSFGAVYTVWTVGMVLGAVYFSPRIGAGAVVFAAFLGVTIQGLGKFVPPFFLVFAVAIGCYFIAGIAHGVKNVMFRTLIHERVPDRLHGRAFAAYNGLRNGAELGALAAGGLLVTALGPSGTLWFAGGISALAGLVGLLALTQVPGHSRKAVTAPLEAMPESAEAEASVAPAAPTVEPG